MIKIVGITWWPVLLGSVVGQCCWAVLLGSVVRQCCCAVLLLEPNKARLLSMKTVAVVFI